jgi:hypothetical protein
MAASRIQNTQICPRLDGIQNTNLPRVTAAILSLFGRIPGHEGFLRGTALASQEVLAAAPEIAAAVADYAPSYMRATPTMAY